MIPEVGARQSSDAWQAVPGLLNECGITRGVWRREEGGFCSMTSLATQPPFDLERGRIY